MSDKEKENIENWLGNSINEKKLVANPDKQRSTLADILY
jgi:hypothetical protein